MPPKKTTLDKEKKSVDKVIPTNECNFIIEMEAKHEAGHYLKVKFDWIKVDLTQESPQITYPVTDTGHLKDWTLL